MEQDNPPDSSPPNCQDRRPHADNGRPVHLLEHKSDFVRVRAPLRDIKVLHESSFNAIAERQASSFIIDGGRRSLKSQINSGVFMTKVRSKV